MPEPVARHILDVDFAYDQTQTRDGIDSGDTLIAGEVVGFLCDAWHIAVTANAGQSHRIVEGGDPQAFYATSAMKPSAIETAVACAREKGLTLAPEFERVQPG